MNEVLNLRDRAWLVNAYVGRNLSLSQIAKEVGAANAACVQYWLKKHGIPRRTVSEGLLLQRGNGITREFLEREYVEKKRHCGDIAEEIGCHHGAIRDSLIRFGIPLRGVKEAKQLQLGKPISSEFLQREYIEKQRSIPDIARELQCSETNVFKWMDEHGIARRPIRLAKLISGHGVIAREVLEREYYQNKKGCDSIALMLGIPRNTVRCWMRYYGMKSRSVRDAVRLIARSDKNPHYYDGRGAERSGLRATSQWREVKRRVFERDGDKCQLCGHVSPPGAGKMEMLEYHHITRDMDRYLDPTNGICLCNRCHMANGNLHTAEIEAKLALLAAQNELRRVTAAAA